MLDLIKVNHLKWSNKAEYILERTTDSVFGKVNSLLGVCESTECEFQKQNLCKMSWEECPKLKKELIRFLNPIIQSQKQMNLIGFIWWDFDNFVEKYEKVINAIYYIDFPALFKWKEFIKSWQNIILKFLKDEQERQIALKLNGETKEVI